MASADSGETVSDTSGPAVGGTLKAQLAIEPHSDANCVVVDQRSEADSLKQRLKIPQTCMETVDEPADCTPSSCGECHTEIRSEDDGGYEYLKSSVHSKCICPVFEEHDCIPEIEGLRNGAIIAVVTVRNRAVLRTLLQDLDAIDATVSVEWLVRGRESESTVEMSVDDITKKQQEALETALDAGYYETPRETNLSALADELSISESAVSQRLNAAETKLVRSFLD